MLRASFFFLIAVILSLWLACGNFSPEGNAFGRVLSLVFGLLLVGSLLVHFLQNPYPENDRIPTDEG